MIFWNPTIRLYTNIKIIILLYIFQNLSSERRIISFYQNAIFEILLLGYIIYMLSIFLTHMPNFKSIAYYLLFDSQTHFQWINLKYKNLKFKQFYRWAIY